MSLSTQSAAQRAQTMAENMIKLLGRGAEASRRQAIEQRYHKGSTTDNTNREGMTEREFVRSFGDKAKHVRYSNRTDFVGLVVVGKFQGFIITSDNSGGRKLRMIDVDEKGHRHVTHRYLRLKTHDSASNLQRGLLKYVR